MRIIWLFICLIGLAACGRPAPDYPATIGALGAAATAEAGRTAELSATLALARADQRRLAATATALALAPTPTPVVVTLAPSPTAPLSATAAGDWCARPRAGAVSYLDAAASAGAAATVQGRIVKVGRSAKALFLNFHEPYHGYFSAVIFANAWRRFAGGIAETYAGRCVRISGTVKLYKGSPEIIVGSPAQIEILEE